MGKDADNLAQFAQFDRLVARKDLLWAPTIPVQVASHGLHFTFRVCPAFLSKPQLDDKPAIAVVKSSPLQSDIHNDDPDFLIGAVGPSHTLILNRYCVYRPQYILVTNDVQQRQSTPLDRADLEAAWTLLHTFERRHFVIYNCGKEAGSSRHHKHLQAFPVPDPPEWFAVFDEDITDLARAKLPYQHFVERLPPDSANVTHIIQQLEHIHGYLLQQAKEALGLPLEDTNIPIPHNVVIVKEWIMVIPRKKARSGLASANAAGMMGMVWVTCKEELEAWETQGPVRVLENFGVQREGVGDSALEKAGGTSSG